MTDAVARKPGGMQIIPVPTGTHLPRLPWTPRQGTKTCTAGSSDRHNTSDAEICRSPLLSVSVAPLPEILAKAIQAGVPVINIVAITIVMIIPIIITTINI